MYVVSQGGLLFGLAVLLACFSFGVWNITYKCEMCKPGEPRSASVALWNSWKIKCDFTKLAKKSKAILQKDMHQFEEELTCSICYSLFEDPRVLPCSHTFCRSCLEGVIQLSSNFSIWRPLRVPLKCPNCRSIVEIPASGTESLPINFALKAIIEKYRQEDHSDVATCSEHYRQPLNVYCLLDKKLVCGHCLTIGKHNGHPIDDLHSAYLKEKESSGKILEQLTDKHWSDICLLIEKLKEQKAQCESIVQDDKKVVVQYFKKLSETLEHKKQVLLAALDEINRQILEEYEPHIEKLKKIREEQLELMSLNTSIQKEESPLVFLEKVDNVHQRIKALKEKELPDVKPVEVYPRVGHLLKDVWSKTEIGQINKILTPKIKLVPKRKLHGKNSEKERGKPEELLQAANPLSVTFIFTVIIAIAVLSFHKPISSVVIESIPTHISDFFVFLYQDFCTCMQNTVDVVCHKLNSLAEFLGGIVPF